MSFNDLYATFFIKIEGLVHFLENHPEFARGKHSPKDTEELKKLAEKIFSQLKPYPEEGY